MRLRQEKKARTREALLDSAAHVFSRRGYHDASLEDIAAEAGFSTGAVYSSFAGKDALFLTLVDREISRETAAFLEAVRGGGTVDERMRRGAAQWLDFLRREPELFMLTMEFWARAVRDPEQRPRYSALREQLTQAVARTLETGSRELDVELPLPARDLAVVLESLADGFALRKLIEPESASDEVFEAAVAALARGALGGTEA
jgi:AcrR family transcriptional regulator